MMVRYQQAIDELKADKFTLMKVHGNSMMPIIRSGTVLTFMACDDYDVGDIVFCKVRGRIIDAHKITARNAQRGWLISNNHGHDNGWTKTIYGKVVGIDGRPFHGG